MPAWSLTAESAEERVCVLMNHSVVEIDMFRLKCDTPNPNPRSPKLETQPRPQPNSAEPQPKPKKPQASS